MTLYCTLADARTELKATNTVDDAVLLARARTASERLDRIFQAKRPFFAPVIETRDWEVITERVYSPSNTFAFDSWLLSLTSVTVNATALVVGTDVEAYPTLHPPFRKLRLRDWTRTWYGYLDTSTTAPPQKVTIAGIWGFHRDYPNAWLSVDALAAGINGSVTSFTVADVDGADPYGRTPRISAGALLRVDTEYMEVISTTVASNTVTVRRGVNGSTAAAHLIAAAVEVWQVEDIIRGAVARQAAFRYAKQGAFESANITDIGIIQFPADLLAEIYGTVAGYAYE